MRTLRAGLGGALEPGKVRPRPGSLAASPPQARRGSSRNGPSEGRQPRAGAWSRKAPASTCPGAGDGGPRRDEHGSAGRPGPQDLRSTPQQPAPQARSILPGALGRGRRACEPGRTKWVEGDRLEPDKQRGSWYPSKETCEIRGCAAEDDTDGRGRASGPRHRATGRTDGKRPIESQNRRSEGGRRQSPGTEWDLPTDPGKHSERRTVTETERSQIYLNLRTADFES